MSRYMYLMMDHTRTKLHTGHCADLKMMLAEYEKFNEMSLNYPPTKFLNRLIYVEEHPSEESAVARCGEITRLTSAQKCAVAKKVNPDLIELIPGVNFELN